MHFQRFMMGDKVYYTGHRHKQDLTSKEGRPHFGWIHAPVEGRHDTYVVWFPDTRDSDSYVMHADVLNAARPERSKNQGPEIAPRRQKREED